MKNVILLLVMIMVAFTMLECGQGLKSESPEVGEGDINVVIKNMIYYKKKYNAEETPARKEQYRKLYLKYKKRYKEHKNEQKEEALKKAKSKAKEAGKKLE